MLFAKYVAMNHFRLEYKFPFVVSVDGWKSRNLRDKNARDRSYQFTAKRIFVYLISKYWSETR